MSWYSKHASDIAFIALLVLAFLGVVVSFVRNLENRKPEKWWFALAFIVLAAIAWHANKTDREQAEARLMGGSNYCFLLLEAPSKTQLSGPYNLMIRNEGGVALLDVNIEGFNEQGRRDYAFQRPVVYPTTSRIAAGAIPIGTYRFDFAARNGRWRQDLRLEKRNGNFVQIIRVERDGEPIYERTMELLVFEKSDGAR